MRRVVALLVAVAGLVPGAMATMPEPPLDEGMFLQPYEERDPYFSDEFDALKACAARVAPAYRYDYDRPTVSSAEQIAAYLRRLCGKEIEALAKLVSPREKVGSPHEMAAIKLDEKVTEPFRPWERLGPRTVPEQAPGTSVSDGVSRKTYFASLSPFAPGEVALVERSTPKFQLPTAEAVTYEGRRQGWRYNYRREYLSWVGAIEKDGLSIDIACRYTSAGINFAQPCEFKMSNRLLALRLRPSAEETLICNPGSDAFASVFNAVRPPPPQDSARSEARQARLIIDGTLSVALPDGDECVRAGANLGRIVNATRLQSTFIAYNDTRTVTVEGSGDAIAAGLALGRHLQTLTFDERMAARVLNEQHLLFARAQPFALRDFVEILDAWPGSVACVVRAAGASRTLTDAAFAAALGGPCAPIVADLLWWAAYTQARLDPSADTALRDPAFAEVAAQMRTLLRGEAAAQLAHGGAPAARAQFSAGEAATSVMGHPGFAALSRDLLDLNAAEYGYSIDGSRAWGVVPNAWFRSLDHPVPPRSVVVTCDAKQVPKCAITIPTDDGRGAFVMRTDGAWHGAALCLSLEGQALEGWRLYATLLFQENEVPPAVLDANGCVREHGDDINAALMISGVGPFLVAPDNKVLDRKRIVSFQSVSLALALSRFLSERVKE